MLAGYFFRLFNMTIKKTAAVARLFLSEIYLISVLQYRKALSLPRYC